MNARLEDLLKQYVSFLKIKGRFRGISYEEKDDKSTRAVAEPFFPEMPRVEAHVSAEKMVIEVVGSSSDHIKSESIRFFDMSGLALEKVTTQMTLRDSLKVFVEGFEDTDYIAVREAIQSAVEGLQYETEEIRVQMTFGFQPRAPTLMARPKLSRTDLIASVSDLRPTEIKKREIRITEPQKPIVVVSSQVRGTRAVTTRPPTHLPAVKEEMKPIEKTGIVGLTDNERLIIDAIVARPKQKAQSNLLSKSTGMPQEAVRKILRLLVNKGVLRVHAGWYVLKTKVAVSVTGIPPYPKITEEPPHVPLTDTDRLLTLNEQKVIEAIRARANQKAQSNLLTKPTKLDQNTLKSVLRSLVRKGFLDMKYGWYTLKSTVTLPSSVKSKTPISDEMVEFENQVLSLIASLPKKKIQASKLAKKLRVPGDKARKTLHNLVASGHLSEKRGWFALVETPASLDRSSDAITKMIIEAIRARPSGRAQSHLLTKPTGLSKEELRHNLKAMVREGLLECKHGWYQLATSS